jgi:rod shape-determining protein MreC
MESFFSRFRNSLVLIAIVLAQVIALAVQVQRPASGFNPGEAHDGHSVTLLRRWITAAVTPFERILHGSSLKVRGVWSNYIDLRHTHEQNQALRKDVDRLREEQAAFAEDAAQGRRLQALLAFKQQYVTTTVAAQVIGTSGSDRSRMLTLDKGAADGLKPEQPVITPDGLVGKLRDVFPHSAQVLVIDDTTSGAGVILASTRIRGILRGTVDGRLQINNLTPDSRIKPGEQVVTSGGDMVFPRGVPVGVVESIAPDPQHQPYAAIVIKPVVNLARLEEVLVVTGTESTLPPAAQQDAATAEGIAAANAEANKRAADLIAEKLPSLHEDTSATPGSNNSDTPVTPDENTVGGVAGIPNSGLPKAKPVLHPDKYSPGATPPADALKPGAPSQSNTAPQTPPPNPQE